MAPTDANARNPFTAGLKQMGGFAHRFEVTEKVKNHHFFRDCYEKQLTRRLKVWEVSQTTCGFAHCLDITEKGKDRTF